VFVQCGSASCAVSDGHECCYAASIQCKAQGTSCYGTRVRCDGPEDCENGQLCCARLTTNGGSYSQIFCRNSCASNETEVCGTDPKVCANPTSCQKSVLLSAVNVCK
jgi:hypothetical protein